jgi:cardiolipin synthase
MLPTELVDALATARQGISRAAWRHVAERVAELAGNPDASSVRGATDGLVNRDAAWVLTQTLLRGGHVPWAQVSAAMVAVDCLVGDRPATAEILWTGPASGRFPVRRMDQMLYDLVSAASRRIVLVTFAAYRIPHLCEHLTRAVERGVQLTLIVESAADSDGQLSFDAVEAFRGVPTATDHLYYWPLTQRARNQAGRPGKLHAKCAIVDDVAIIGSANFTDDAFNRNMELGVLVNEPAAVAMLNEHFTELIRNGVLAPALPMGRV